MAASSRPADVLFEIHERQRADGPAAILAIGTAYPTNCIQQDEFTDWYFRVTKSEHLTKLKSKMKKVCDNSGIQKRHFHHAEEMIGVHPEIIDRAAPSLGARQAISAVAAHNLAADAASRAISAWGRPAADITHLVVTTNAGSQEPGTDLRLAGLRPAVRRTLLRRDIAENNRGARVLVACTQAHLLLSGADADADADAEPAGPVVVERPVFHMASASQTTLPGTEHSVVMNLTESGLVHSRLSVEVPALVRGSIEWCLADTLAPLGLPNFGDGGWNGLFWALHPGGRAILDSYEAALGLEAGKLAASRHVLSEYGNMSGSTVIFVLDEIRRHRRCRRQDGSDKDCQWGVMSALGPGLTIETLVLHSAGSHDGN
ncbi:unnamed protein product [Urochloa decumbens]|uniref:Chalcone synthase n=1 Tax=Urochloa decumbens TaxID=240449 RepID=A0ABC9ATV8_9POAL